MMTLQFVLDAQNAGAVHLCVSDVHVNLCACLQSQAGWSELAPPQHLSTRIVDAGIAIRYSQGYITSFLQDLEMGWRGWCLQSTA